MQFGVRGGAKLNWRNLMDWQCAVEDDTDPILETRWVVGLRVKVALIPIKVINKGLLLNPLY